MGMSLSPPGRRRLCRKNKDGSSVFSDALGKQSVAYAFHLEVHTEYLPASCCARSRHSIKKN